MAKTSPLPKTAPLARPALKAAPLRVVAAGHVDHGKSTLIGRLLHECGAMPQAKTDEITKAAERRGVEFEWAFLLDALQSERNQNVTIDSSRLWLRRPERDLIFIDVPGHEQFLKNMINGAAEAELGLLVVDVGEPVTPQARRHGLLMRILGIRDVIVVVNKMDRADFDATRFNDRAKEAQIALAELGLNVVEAIPVSARAGDNLAAPSKNLNWFKGPTLLQALDAQQARENTATKAPLRLVIQDVLRRGEERIYLGQILAGKINAQQDVLILPINRSARIRAIYKGIDSHPCAHAFAGEAVALTLDYPLFIERGALICTADQAPKTARNLTADIFWLKDALPSLGDKYNLRMGALAVPATIVGEEVSPVHGELRRLKLKTSHGIAFENGGDHAPLGRFLLKENGMTIALGSFVGDASEDERQTLNKSTNIGWTHHRVDAQQRAIEQGHRGLVVWLTGLPASGKSTLAMELEKRLFERGWPVYVLDGDNLRHGLSADLSFEAKDRKESIRRAGEVAELFSDAGVIALVALVSPFTADRQQARKKSEGHFFEVYVKASVDACAARDPKKHYEKARRGEIKGFTGVDAPYESPESPDLVIDTESMSVESAASLLEESILAWAKL